ncbi:MAG: hypothetical protein HY885_10440 [Deltaproteobacteria bacterium]|nr:hypothetical protein [Deltaproteobacteria bacterium]
MKYSLSDLFIGVVDIFVIFLPGGLLIAVLLHGFPELKVNTAIPGDEAGKWLLFLALSFILGHFISMAGAALEDWEWQKKGIVSAKDDVSPELREEAGSIVKEAIPPRLVEEENVRRWAAVLLRKDEQSRRVVERIDADRRFFRNFRVLMVFSFILFLIPADGSSIKRAFLVAGSLLFLVLAHLRYRGQDKKFTKTVFETIVANRPAK